MGISVELGTTSTPIFIYGSVASGNFSNLGGLKRLVAVPHTTLSTDVHIPSFCSGLNVVIWLVVIFI